MSRLAKFITPLVPDIVKFRLAMTPPPKSSAKGGGRISFINTHDLAGGAAKVAYTLAKGLQKSKDVRLYVRYKMSDEDWVRPLPPRANGRFDYYIDRAEQEGGWLDLARLEPLALLGDEHFRSSNIIHFHNLHGGYFSYALLPLLSQGRHAVWTLHDEHMLTGHCAVTLGCDQWQRGCGSCPKLDTYPAVIMDRTAEMRRIKEAAYALSNLHVVCPSMWLADRVRQAFPKLEDVRVIPNGIDTSVFRPRDQQSARAELGLPQNTFLLLYAAEMGVDTPYKGGAVVREVTARLDGLDEVAVVTIGDRSAKVNERHFQIPPVRDEGTMAKVYAACDMLLYPTKADNLPLVVLESMACGTPVVASAIGGIPEIITHGSNGYLVTDFDSADAFMSQIAVYREMSEDGRSELAREAHSTVTQCFSMKRMQESYMGLYKELMNNSL